MTKHTSNSTPVNQDVFQKYHARKSDNTLRAHSHSLVRFADYLSEQGIIVKDLQNDPESWRGITWAEVEGFRDWMVAQGDAMGSITSRLSTVRTYAKLATKAGAISKADILLIASTPGFTQSEARQIDGERDITRRGHKKAEHVSISDDQARQLKDQPNTPQGRRDALLMCLLLDHGLRCGEVMALTGENFDLTKGMMTFYRPKTDITSIHELSRDTLRALRAWIENGDAPIMQSSPILRASRKGGHLTDAGMTERAITDRVRTLAERIGIDHMSALDCRHYCATHDAQKVAESQPTFLTFQEKMGWASIQSARIYVERATIANQNLNDHEDN